MEPRKVGKNGFGRGTRDMKDGAVSGRGKMARTERG